MFVFKGIFFNEGISFILIFVWVLLLIILFLLIIKVFYFCWSIGVESFVLFSIKLEFKGVNFCGFGSRWYLFVWIEEIVYK